MFLRRVLVLFFYVMALSSLFLLVTTSAAQTADPREVIKAEASYDFGKVLRFNLLVKSDQEVTGGVVKINGSDLDSEAVVPLRVSEIEPGLFELKTAIDLKSVALRAFSLVHYTFEYSLADGSEVPGKDLAFVYQDDRFEWQQTGSGPIRISWYTGDEAQAGRLQLIAQQSLASIHDLLGLEAPANLDIYVYNSKEDLLDALPQTGQDWTGGYVDAVAGVLLVSLPSGTEQSLQAEQQLPHELMHLVLARQAGKAHTPFPAWLEEGLASAVEYFPNADFSFVLQKAVRNGNLLEIPDLCTTLPRDPANAFLAYAQSASFVQYLLTRYEASGMRRLVAAYSTGLDCETGVRFALGSSLHTLERQWRHQELGENITKTTAIKLGPWLLFLMAMIILPLLGILISSRQRRKEEHQ